MPRLPVSVTLAGLSIPTSAMVSAASSPILAAVSYMRIRSMRFLRDLASPVPHAVSNALVCSSPRWSTGSRAGGLTRMPAASLPSAVNAGCSRPAWSRNTRIVVILSMMVRSEYPRSVRIHSTHRPRRARSKCPKPMWLRCVPSVVSSHRT